MLVRPGAVVPLGAVDDRPDYDHAAGDTLRIHPGSGSTVTRIISADGRPAAVFTVDRSESRTRVTADRPVDGWSVLLVGAALPSTVRGAEAEAVADGVLLRARTGTVTVEAVG